MNYYKAIIQYDGSGYAGFQWQNETPTIQSEINLALSKILEGKVTTTAASRTDTGVHAFEQVVKISSVNKIETSSFLASLNNALPSQIQAIHIESCEGRFKPAAEALSKEYRYFFTNKSQASGVDNQFIANISNKLDIELMNQCLKALTGTHDFCNFYSSGSNVKTTVRNITFCELSIINPHDVFSDNKIFKIPQSLEQCYQLKIIANGFLKQMIRHLVSALWMVGSGKITPEFFLSLLDAPKVEKQLWKVAPPNGLFLYSIKY